MNSKVRCKQCRSYFDRAEAVWHNSMQHICSNECLHIFMANHGPKKRVAPAKPRKPRPPAPKIPVAMRYYIKERDGHCCRVCGRRGTQCHHVQFRSAGGKDVAHNLITLCADCHRDRAHGPDAARYRELFRGYIWMRMVEQRMLTVPEVETLCRSRRAA